jgi:hypothetical protein
MCRVVQRELPAMGIINCRVHGSSSFYHCSSDVFCASAKEKLFRVPLVLTGTVVGELIATETFMAAAKVSTETNTVDVEEYEFLLPDLIVCCIDCFPSKLAQVHDLFNWPG